MAGTLLLIQKNNTSAVDFEQKIAHLRSKVENTFAAHYPVIDFSKPDKNSFLVEFRKDKEKKFFKSNDGSWLTYEGCVFALNETKALDAEELLNCYLTNKQQFSNLLDGHFVIKLFDSNTGEHVIINDFIKNKTNFICDTADYIMFTPFAITTAIIHPPELDLEAFNEFLWRYYILSEKSILKGVLRLRPASIYSWDENRLTQKTYWQWPKTYTSVKFKEAVAKSAKSMQESARLISNKFGKPCIDFTMGQDTRQVISAFTSQKINFTTSIFGKSDFYEVKKIKEIAQKFGIENNTIQLHDDYSNKLWKHYKNASIIGSCEEPGYLLGRLIYMRKQQSKFAKVSLNGMDGHFYKNGLWDEMYTFNLYREPKRFNIGAFLKLRALSKKYDDSIFNADFKLIKAHSEDYFREKIEVAIKGYENSPVSMQVDRFDLYHWLNFTTVSNNSGNLVHNSISPLLLRRNLEFALQIPVRWKFNLSKFQRAIVYKLDPELAKVKTDFAGVNMVPKNIFTIVPFYFRYFYFQSDRLRKKIKSKLGFNVVSHLQEAWDYLPLYKKLYNDPEFQDNLNYETLELKTIIVKTEWKKFLQKYENPDDPSLNDFEYLFKLVSVECFLREVKKWNK